MKTYIYLCSGKIEAWTQAANKEMAIASFEHNDYRLCMNTEVVCLDDFPNVDAGKEPVKFEDGWENGVKGWDSVIA